MFDSGVGGLTVARSVLDQLPHEQVLYIGDTANGPYGPRDIAEVRSLALSIMDELVDRGVKLLVIACNTASAAVLHDARERYTLGRGVPVIEVIHPAARTAARVTRNGRVGLIATRGTVDSRAYDDALQAVPGVELFSESCPRFVDLAERGVKVEYLHSDVDTLRRVELLRELRLGTFDVLVGINLLREGLDLPEVSLVSILDADKEGFLRSTRSLIQTIGRAARNVSGEVHMYADTITPAMAEAIEETERRRTKQLAYNTEHGIDPQPLRKKIADILDQLTDTPHEDTPDDLVAITHQPNSTTEIQQLITTLTTHMGDAARDLNFELAARLRDEIADLKKQLRGMKDAGL